MKALRRQLGGYKYWFRPDSGRSGFKAALRAKLFARWSASTIIIVITLVSSLSPAVFIDWFGGGKAFAASQGPLTATASGDCTQVDYTSGTVSWTSPGNAFSDNATRATVSVDGTTIEYVQCVNFGFTIPAGSTINGITLSIQRHSSSATGSNDASVRLVKGGTLSGADKASGTAYGTTVDAVANYGGTSDLWSTTWSTSEVNASNFGAALASTKPSSAGAAHTVSVDVMTITVEYTVNPSFEQSTYRWFENTDSSNITAWTLGGAAEEEATGFEQTSDGGYVVAG